MTEPRDFAAARADAEKWRVRAAADGGIDRRAEETLAILDALDIAYRRLDQLEDDRARAWAAMEYAVNWIQQVFGDTAIRASSDEWLDVRDRLLSAGEFQHMIAEPRAALGEVDDE